MKKIYVFLLLLLIIVLKVKASTLPLIGKVIYIDPGHGGIDIGTSYKEIYEKDINLNISKILKNKLELQGATVYLTRYGDYDLAKPNYTRRKLSDLSNRVKLINDIKCDLYLSIHVNYYTNNIYRGVQLFYTEKNSKNIILANALKDSINTKRDIKIIKDKYMYNNINLPGVLLEVGFLSNPNDRYLLQNDNYIDKLTNKITNGIVNYGK